MEPKHLLLVALFCFVGYHVSAASTIASSDSPWPKGLIAFTDDGTYTQEQWKEHFRSPEALAGKRNTEQCIKPDSITHTAFDISWTISFVDRIECNGKGFALEEISTLAIPTILDVLDYMASHFDFAGSITLEISESDTTAQALAQGGSFYYAASGWLRSKFHTKLATGRSRQEQPDAFMQYQFQNNDWIYLNGTKTKQRQVDFWLTTLHELTHALGFVSSVGDITGTSQFSSSVDLRTRFDEHLFSLSEQQFLFDRTTKALIVPSAVLDGKSGEIVTRGDNVVDLLTITALPVVHAPSPYVKGSSLSHIDKRQGYTTSMEATSSLECGRHRGWSALDLAMLKDMGINVIGEPLVEEPAPECTDANDDSVDTGGVFSPGSSTAIAIYVAIGLVFLIIVVIIILVIVYFTMKKT